MIKALVFDWGDTIMKDFSFPGPMSGWAQVAWIDGAEEALMQLNKKYICIIATSADHSDTEEMKKALSRVGADRYFHYFFSQKELGYKKPDVRFFIEVMRQAGFESSACAMIGNLYEKDIIGAKQAGMRTIFFNENGLEGAFPLADHQINRMEQLLDLL
ncbi:MAG: HAD family hydrolase [Bacteroidetes bacterium]|jgi:FMN phosphatase YigB (HAD superfamily)|nr:HAD family hydrolase [Bacteroidota bacterium]